MEEGFMSLAVIDDGRFMPIGDFIVSLVGGLVLLCIFSLLSNWEKPRLSFKNWMKITFGMYFTIILTHVVALVKWWFNGLHVFFRIIVGGVVLVLLASVLIHVYDLYFSKRVKKYVDLNWGNKNRYIIYEDEEDS